MGLVEFFRFLEVIVYFGWICFGVIISEEVRVFKKIFWSFFFRYINWVFGFSEVFVVIVFVVGLVEFFILVFYSVEGVMKLVFRIWDSVYDDISSCRLFCFWMSK